MPSLKIEIEPNLHFPRSAFADCVRTFNANDFNFPPTIAGIIVIQNLSRLEHDASLPVRTLSQQNSKLYYTNSVWVRPEAALSVVTNASTELYPSGLAAETPAIARQSDRFL
jgi:hypothetical protein